MPRFPELPAPIVADIADPIALADSLSRKGKADPGDGLYPRDGTALVREIELRLAEITIPGIQPVIWSTGMAAVREAVNCAADLKGQEWASQGRSPIISHGLELYAQSAAYFRKERSKGVSVSSFDSGDEGSVTRAIRRGADVLFAETVANTPDMSVLNVHALLEQVRNLERPPIVILDNTLPLSTGINFADLLQPTDPVIIVDSGTKIVMNNSGSLGITYSANEALLERLRKHKAHSGATNSIEALPAIANKVEASIPSFHERNRAAFRSTGQIAVALFEAQAELGSKADFNITHPIADPTHSNHEYAARLASLTTDGNFGSPVVFIGAEDGTGSDEPVVGLFNRISNHPAVRQQIGLGQVSLGQSFGLPGVKILCDPKAGPNIRFAGGYDLDDSEALAAAIKEAALAI